MSAQVTAVIVGYNSLHALPACIMALQQNGVTEIILVDNASTDDTAAWAATQPLRLVANAQNQGFGCAMNQGVVAATTDYCLLLNPDLVLDDGAVAALLQATDAYPDAILFGPQIIEEDGRVFFQPRSLLAGFLPNPQGTVQLPSAICSVPFLSGACYLVRRAAFLQLGGFDPNIFLFYEDDDLCRRISDVGQPPLYVPMAVARHGRGKSSKAADRAALLRLAAKIRWHLAWSRFYVLKKYNMPAPAGGWLLRFTGKYLLALLLGQAAKRARYKGSFMGALAFVRGQSALRQEGLILPDSDRHSSAVAETPGGHKAG